MHPESKDLSSLQWATKGLGDPWTGPPPPFPPPLSHMGPLPSLESAVTWGVTQPHGSLCHVVSCPKAFLLQKPFWSVSEVVPTRSVPITLAYLFCSSSDSAWLIITLQGVPLVFGCHPSTEYKLSKKNDFALVTAVARVPGLVHGSSFNICRMKMCVNE